MGSELGRRRMAQLVVYDGGKVIGAWNKVANL